VDVGKNKEMIFGEINMGAVYLKLTLSDNKSKVIADMCNWDVVKLWRALFLRGIRANLFSNLSPIMGCGQTYA
jgi:hypothetical protein